MSTTYLCVVNVVLRKDFVISCHTEINSVVFIAAAQVHNRVSATVTQSTDVVVSCCDHFNMQLTHRTFQLMSQN